MSFDFSPISKKDRGFFDVKMETVEELLQEIRSCNYCKGLPLGPSPVLILRSAAKILIVGQAPGTKVHFSGIPWNDPSGDELRRWLDMDKNQFYSHPYISIVPMGFCYPGKGKSGDLPPRPECAPRWHSRVLRQMPNLKLRLLVGSYSQSYYLCSSKTLTENVRNWKNHLEKGFFPLPHPSPRNRLWQKRNPWFEKEVIPALRQAVAQVLET